MSIFGAVTRHVDAQKAELINYLIDVNALDARSAVDLTGMKLSQSVLREMMNRKIVVKTSGGKFFVDATRVNQAVGASNSFILWAMGLSLLAMGAMAWFFSRAGGP